MDDNQHQDSDTSAQTGEQEPLCFSADNNDLLCIVDQLGVGDVVIINDHNALTVTGTGPEIVGDSDVYTTQTVRLRGESGREYALRGRYAPKMDSLETSRLPRLELSQDSGWKTVESQVVTIRLADGEQILMDIRAPDLLDSCQ